MRRIWALLAVFRLAVASQITFSVHEDLLAYPQVCHYTQAIAMVS